jgi:hypothetical protein
MCGISKSFTFLSFLHISYDNLLYWSFWFFPLILSDIDSINERILILKIIGQCDVKTHWDITDENINFSFEGLD